MKQSIRHFIGGLFLLAMPLMLTSCEGMFDDIFGEWSRPGSKEEALANLSSALEEGALVTITYTIDGVEYTSTFKKVGDEYIEQSTAPAASRTRTYVDESGPIDPRLLPIQKDALNFQVYKNRQLTFSAEINTNNIEITNNITINNSSLNSINVNGNKTTLKSSSYTLKVTIYEKNNEEQPVELGTISYAKGETWQKVYQRFRKNGNMILGRMKDGDNNLMVFALTHPGSISYNDNNDYHVHPTDIVGEFDGNEHIKYYVDKFEPIEYKEAVLNENNVASFTPQSVSDYTFVTSSDANVTWSEGTYVVKESAHINGDLKIEGNVKLILCNGKTLTVSGEIRGRIINKMLPSFSIYGQDEDFNNPPANPAGKFKVSSEYDGIVDLRPLSIHGGYIEVMGKTGIHRSNINMYGGKLSSFGTRDNAISISNDAYGINIYRGMVNAKSSSEGTYGIFLKRKYFNFNIYSRGILTSYGPGGAFKGNLYESDPLKDFWGSDNGSTWEKITTQTTDKKYLTTIDPTTGD